MLNHGRLASYGRLSASAALATASAVVSHWVEHDVGIIRYLWLPVVFMLLFFCVSLIVDETVVRVREAIDLARLRQESEGSGGDC